MVPIRHRHRRNAIVVAVLAFSVSSAIVPGARAETFYLGEVGTVAAPRAECGPGSLPETGLQGDVPAEDRNNLRSTQGYRCNLSLVGGLQDRGGGVVSATFDHCSYTSTFFPGNLPNIDTPGVQVVDVSDPGRPRLAGSLNEPGMVGGTWESMKVNQERKLLAATAVGLFGQGGGYFSVYDISDCEHPRLLNRRAGTELTMPLPFTSHEGGFSPDGRTYWASGLAPGLLTAIDIADPADPRVIWQSVRSLAEHGFGISPDGNTMYLSVQAGITILDISAVQRRDPHPQVPELGTYLWTDGLFNQQSVPVTYRGVPHIFSSDEASSGGVKVFDVSDPAHAKQVAQIKLEINLPEHTDAKFRSASGGSFQTYDAHYCVADRPNDPTALACSWMSSGIRVFDVRDPYHIREIAYYNPPAQTGRNLQLTNSSHAWAELLGLPLNDVLAVTKAIVDGKFDPAVAFGPRAGQVAFGDLSSDWCMSPPTFHGTQIWTTCSDNGFLALQLDNDVYTPPVDQESTIGS